MDDFKSQPLTDIWDIYTESLDQAISSGLLHEEELADDYVWPNDLRFGDWEQNDVKRYVHDRLTEITERYNATGNIDPNLVAGYIFRSVISGMLWEKARIG